MKVSIHRSDCLEALVVIMNDATDESIKLRNCLDAAVTDAAFYGLDDEYVAVEIGIAEEAALRLRQSAKNEWVARRRMRFGKACERILAEIGEDGSAEHRDVR